MRALKIGTEPSARPSRSHEHPHLVPLQLPFQPRQLHIQPCRGETVLCVRQRPMLEVQIDAEAGFSLLPVRPVEPFEGLLGGVQLEHSLGFGVGHKGMVLCLLGVSEFLRGEDEVVLNVIKGHGVSKRERGGPGADRGH